MAAEGEAFTAILRAGLDWLAEQDPALVMERVGNGVIGELVDLESLRLEDVTEVTANAEGEMARDRNVTPF